MDLSQRRAGNVLFIKLISQENLMDEWRDSHDHTNIDASHVCAFGKHVVLPHGMSVAH